MKWWLFIATGLVCVTLVGGWVWPTYLGGNQTSEQAEQSGEIIQGGNAGNLVDEDKSEQVSVDNLETIEDDQTYASIKDVIRSFHDFYNRTLGYGRISQVSWSEQRENAQLFIDYVEHFEGTYKGTLKTDINRAKSNAVNIAEGSEDKDNLTRIHRILHDLDIAVNGFSNYQKVWGVTETKVQ